MRLRYPIDSIDYRHLPFLDFCCQHIAPLIEAYFRAELRGSEHVPKGAALYVGNHNAGLMGPEMYILGPKLYRQLGIDALPYGLGHDFVFALPVVNQFFVPLGAVRADHDVAAKIFARDRKALVFPGGDFDAFRPSSERYRIVFGGRLGYVRLALRHGVPIVPVVTAGAHDCFRVLSDNRWLARWLRAERWARCKVWPLSLSIPWGLYLGPTPPYLPLPVKVLLEVLPEMRFDRHGDEAVRDQAYVASCAAQVEAAMQACLTRLGRELEARGHASSRYLGARRRRGAAKQARRVRAKDGAQQFEGFAAAARSVPESEPIPD